MERFDRLQDVVHASWHLLIRSQHERNHPMRTPAIATLSGDQPAVRTVVLRKVDMEQRRLRFYTDRRSEKVAEWNRQRYVAWMFWDAHKKVQIRASGPTTALDRELSSSIWNQLLVGGRKSYATLQAPGTPADDSTDGLRPDWSTLDPADTDLYFDHFLVLETEVTTLDILHLHPDGHQRAQFQWDSSRKDWNAQWVIP